MALVIRALALPKVTVPLDSDHVVVIGLEPEAVPFKLADDGKVIV